MNPSHQDTDLSPTHSRSGLVVLGTHRSGTSTLAGALHSSGVPMGNSFWPAGEDNVRGFFEHRELVALGERLLATHDSSWDSPVFADCWSADEHGMIADEIARTYQTISEDHACFAIKEPRIARFLGPWDTAFEQLAVTPFWLWIARDPLAVARSLLKRNKLPLEQGFLIWAFDNIRIARFLRGRPHLVVSYERLVNDRENELARLVSLLPFDLRNYVPSLDLAAGGDFIDPELDHGGASAGIAIPGCIRNFFEQIQNASQQTPPIWTDSLVVPEPDEVLLSMPLHDAFYASYRRGAEAAKEIRRLETLMEDKQAGLAAQAAEIRRLESYSVEKDAIISRLMQEPPAPPPPDLPVVTRLHRPRETGFGWFGRTLARFARRPPPESSFCHNLEMPSEFERAPRTGVAAGWVFFKPQDVQIIAVRMRTSDYIHLGRMVSRPDVHAAHPRAGDYAGFVIPYDLPEHASHHLEFEALLDEGGVWHRFANRTLRCPVPSTSANDCTYEIKVPPSERPDRPRIVHALANFMIGGSSRLVIDLVEHLGGHYEQSVLTSHVPAPPVYLGIPVREIRREHGNKSFLEHLSRLRPALLHVHYWGDVDEPWYADVFKAAEQLGIPVLQNINTPVDPFSSPAIWKNVYVSETIRREFPCHRTPSCVIYPGSDFSLFTRPSEETPPAGCVGMVYRLERDKLDEKAIEPFIRCVQLRPETRVLIVGGGSLLEPFRRAVATAGLSRSFEFTGYVPYQALPALYRRMSLFIAPVWKESFGQVSPFAMHMRVPVAGYAVGAIPEIVDDPGMVAPVGDPDALAALMVRLLDDADRRRHQGERQAQRAATIFSVQGMIAGYRRLYATQAASP